jgi:hypothetical protein
LVLDEVNAVAFQGKEAASSGRISDYAMKLVPHLRTRNGISAQLISPGYGLGFPEDELEADDRSATTDHRNA